MLNDYMHTQQNNPQLNVNLTRVCVITFVFVEDSRQTTCEETLLEMFQKKSCQQNEYCAFIVSPAICDCVHEWNKT